MHLACDMQVRSREARHLVAVAHGAFDVVTGVWPLLSMRTFQAVTGPKREHWLVKTVGVTIAAIGGTLAIAGARRRVTPEIATLGIASAAGLALVDVVYVARRRISPVYLVDAVVELAWIAAWARTAWRGLDEVRPRSVERRTSYTPTLNP